MAGIGKKISGAAIALALCSSSSFAAVATSAPAAVNPYAVIGVYGSPAAAQALCGNAATAAAAGAAAAAAQAPAGCVLPVVDAAPVVADAGPPPLPPVAASGGIGIWPVLLALGALAGLALLISGDDDDNNDGVPVSPA
ncbi:hypothetical protein G7076_04620 [Sphingomonas sp. HDW15A]|uniref:hypothetical protein n=1 Tax=Sphingomonas sp. HDW15A TaxID=2714942 RepID=UPI001408FA3F|nr:hypothetical protein [Sphingomonas sp. HDW15A]QIK95845.1 hypothetical protein G7076_04620 [Sphingomonas sp. HDW15A]